jgi:hypothetical protein
MMEERRKEENWESRKQMDKNRRTEIKRRRRKRKSGKIKKNDKAGEEVAEGHEVS